MRAALAACALAALLSACAKQDAALLVTFKGGYRIPQNADTLSVDVREGTNVLFHKDYALGTMSQSTLNNTLTLVQSGADHPKVRIDGTLKLQGSTVGVGRADASFESGQTVNVTVEIVPPQ